MQYNRNFSLIEYNSFRLESKATEIWFPETLDELVNILQKLKNEDFEVLGGGTNIIMNKEINRVICLKKMPKDISIFDNVLIINTNISTDIFVKTVLNRNFTGVEGLLGIPGTIGGAIVMNSGSGKYCISDYLTQVYTLDRKGKIKRYSREDLKLARRYSIFQDKDEIIVMGIFEFLKLKIDKNEIKKAIEHRKSLPKAPSAGGIFVNWHALKPYRKQLIGLSVRDAYVSDSINIIVNRGNATAKDILSLIDKIKHIVKTPLKLEIKIMGNKKKD